MQMALFSIFSKKKTENLGYINKAFSNEDELYYDIIQFVIDTQKVSTSMLQRRYGLGYNCAAKFIDQLQNDGIIDKAQGSKSRKVLIDTIDEVSYFNLHTYDDTYLSSFDIDNMTGIEFERFALDLLKKNGFLKVVLTPFSGDFGVDVIAYKDEVKYAIQCKRYSSPVGIKAIQEVIGSKSMNDCHVAVVLTNNTFTSSAKELAKKNNVLLWDKQKLDEMIRNAEKCGNVL